MTRGTLTVGGPKTPDASEVVHGTVKWFDPAKGFGFVLPSKGGPDILLHANVLQNFGQNSVVDGAQIEILAQHTSRGQQATQVIQITTDEDIVLPLHEAASYTLDQIASMPVEPVRVKWFDRTKGFGFGNVFGRDEDIFIHIDILRRSGQCDLQTGEAIGLRIINGRRGKMAIDVVVWEDVGQRAHSMAAE